jgi:type VI secretion system secreted protein Hcp
MALEAYLTLTGKKQGPIHGPVKKKGRENSIPVHSFSQEVISPRDSASGMPTGKRVHKPITILKEIDKTSPRLWTLLVDNETISTWELQIWETGPGATGEEKEIYSIRLTDASIASMRESMPDNEDPSNAKLPLREEIAFTYQKIQWTWIDGGITAVDDWEDRV